MTAKIKFIEIVFGLLGLLLLFEGCHKSSKYDYVYPNDPKISDIHGWPHDSTLLYFPGKIHLRDSLIRIGGDTTYLKDYSEILHCAKEPILFNYNLYRDCYRITYSPSFGSPLVIVLLKDENHVQLTVKKIHRYLDTSFTYPVRTFIIWSKGKSIKMHDQQLVIKYDPAMVIFNKKVSIEVWETFENIIKRNNYRGQSSIGERGQSVDGVDAVLEHQSKYRYWFVDRQGEVAGMHYLAVIAGIILP
jgi:hypothetical protein